MAWSNKIRLNKQLLRTVGEAGYHTATELQQKIMPRIIGGQDLVAVAPEGSGKTTTYLLTVLNRFSYQADGVPKILILVPSQEGVEAVIRQFEALNRNQTIRLVGLYATPGTEAQMDALADGADIVVATPDRARAIYLKLGLNLNKIEVFIIDDADVIIKQGLQLPTAELANSIVKAQRLVFTEVLHDKLYKLIENFMPDPVIIEVEQTGNITLNLHSQVLYHVPNFGTKVNLLNLFLRDEDLFSKTAVFVNTSQTAEKVYQRLQIPGKNVVAVFNSANPALQSLDSVANFTNHHDVKMLIVANQDQDEMGFNGVPFLVHFDVPDDRDQYIDRVSSDTAGGEEETLAIIFATDLELSGIRKIEQATGQKIPVMDLPDDLLIEQDRKRSDLKSEVPTDDPTRGGAFHEKKAKNAKDYNYSSGEKARMNKKKKHG